MGIRGRWWLPKALLAVGVFLAGHSAWATPPGYPASPPPEYGYGPVVPRPNLHHTIYRPVGYSELVQPSLPDTTAPDKGALYYQENGGYLGPGNGGPHLVPGGPKSEPGPLPREKHMASHPAYTVAPPDILLIDAQRLIPRPPYRVEPLEVLFITVTGTLPNQPILGQLVISPEGTVNLGFDYGSVRVGGLTLDQVHTAIRQHLAKSLANPQVAVSLAQFRGLQQIRGEHLVRPDGTISLGTYGCVYVAGLTLCQIKEVVEKHLSQFLLNPEIAVDVFAYNSQVYYVIMDGAGYGQQVFRLPITGNETVLDAISAVQGLAPVSSKKYIWLARPSPCQYGCNQILPVDWNAITQGGATCTNYQIFPGDRIFVKGDCLVAADNYLAKLLAPVERILGVTLLTTNVVGTMQNISRGLGTGTIGIVTP